MIEVLETHLWHVFFVVPQVVTYFPVMPTSQVLLVLLWDVYAFVHCNVLHFTGALVH